MKAAAACCLVVGILSVGGSFALVAPPIPATTSEERAVMEAEAEAAHQELADPTAEQLEAQEAAQARVLQQIEQNELAMARFERRRSWLRLGGCGIAALGIGLFLAARGGPGQA